MSYSCTLKVVKFTILVLILYCKSDNESSGFIEGPITRFVSWLVYVLSNKITCRITWIFDCYIHILLLFFIFFSLLFLRRILIFTTRWINIVSLELNVSSIKMYPIHRVQHIRIEVPYVDDLPPPSLVPFLHISNLSWKRVFLRNLSFQGITLCSYHHRWRRWWITRRGGWWVWRLFPILRPLFIFSRFLLLIAMLMMWISKRWEFHYWFLLFL